MKAVIFGLGSIGKRHIRLLHTYFPEVEIWHYNRGDYYQEIGPWFEKLVDGTRWDALPLGILSHDDFSVISTPSEAHLTCARACAEMGLSLFIEKPICTNTSGLDDLIRMVRSKGLLAYIAYPLRFHPIVEYLKNFPPAGCYRFVCHSDATRWPSARKLDHVVWELSHEIDLAQYLLGTIRGIRGECSASRLRAEIVCEHAGGARSELSLRLDADHEERFIGVDGHVYPIWADDGMYLKQWCHFVSRLKLKQAGKYAGTVNDLHRGAGLCRMMESFLDEAGCG